MNDVKLTDFSADELQALLGEVVNGIGTWTSPEHIHTYQALCLWRTQILNAISTVKMRAIPEQN